MSINNDDLAKRIASLERQVNKQAQQIRRLQRRAGFETVKGCDRLFLPKVAKATLIQQPKPKRNPPAESKG